MLFLISWSISSDNRVPCWNVFGNMTPADDLKDAGEHINIVGRWHHLSGDGGVCICETDNVSALNSFMLNWSPICDIKVSPMVDDAMARASIQTKPYFMSKSAAAASADAAEKADDSASADNAGDSGDAAEKAEEAPVDV